MVKKEYNDESTRNARIKIDYRGKKPRVSFNYPNIKDYESTNNLFAFLVYYFFIFSVFWGFVNVMLFIEDLVEGNNSNLGFYLLYLFLISVLPLILYFIFQKSFKKLYPKLVTFKNIMTDTHYKIKLNKNDIREHNNKIFIEIPLFSNIFFNYDARKDFSKYLDYFEIKEYPLKEIERYDKKKLESATDIFWYVRFYFNQKPIDGNLEVMFK